MNNKQKPLIVMYMHKMPYPLENGTNQRIYAMVQFLKKEYRLGLVIPYNDPGTEELKKVFDEIWFRKRHSHKMGKFKTYVRRLIDKLFFYLLFTKHILRFRKNPLGKFNIAAVATLYKICKSEKPSLIICQKIFNSVLSTAIAHRFNIPVLIDIHDLHKLQIHGQKEKLNVNLGYLGQITDVNEKELLQVYDGLIAIQHQEAQVLAYHFPDKKIITALHPVTNVFLQENTKHIYTDRPVLLFVASASIHNKDAIMNFINHHLDYIVKYHPNVVLNICGDVGKIMRVNHRSIILLGRIDNLKPYYEEATLVINPVRHGAGLKIKTIDALAAGKCLVTTQAGSEGLLEIDTVLVCVDAEELGKKIVDLLNNREKIRSYELAAYDYAKAHLTAENCYTDLKNLIREFVPL